LEQFYLIRAIIPRQMGSTPTDAWHLLYCTTKLAWNKFKDFLESRGARNLYDSKDTTRADFKTGLIEKGEAAIWQRRYCD